jgi:phosphoenolpyruvate carboxykinase (ATP)
MQQVGKPSQYSIEHHGLYNIKNIYWNCLPPVLIEESIRRNEGQLAPGGAIVVSTGSHTGRSPNDKFVVKTGDPEIDNKIWWGKVNTPLSEEKFDQIFTKMTGYLQGKDIFVQDLTAGAHPDFAMPIRIITEKAWQSLFAYDLLRRTTPKQRDNHTPQFTVIACPDFQADSALDGTNSGTFIIVNFKRRLVIIGGTHYAGEIKKSVFTIMNYLLPQQGVLSMHCSANVGQREDVALFFGLSGTGKTTLSSDPERRLIGDDEHGWSDTSIFNVEGGCYAKTIRLRSELEPIIWDATQRFSSVLENVVYDPETRRLDFDSDKLTENTRGAYPLDFVTNHVIEGYAGHPENIFFLTADAFGVLPPISKLTADQAMYYFLSGYTSKLAGTETGLGSEPQATFSTCFGAPFLPLHPSVYAELLGKKIEKHQVQVWLLNTGWTGGAFGTGSRMRLPFTRAMIRAALTHKLDNIEMIQEPYFGLYIPTSCPEVPNEILQPSTTWNDLKGYEAQASNLIQRFVKNFEQFANTVPVEVVKSGPQIK